MAFVGIFQSTLPAWGETEEANKNVKDLIISIHSPRMGRDPEGLPQAEARDAQFQSTLPAWGETGRLCSRQERLYFNPLSPHGERQQTHTTFRREKLAHLHNIVSFRQQRGSSC